MNKKRGIIATIFGAILNLLLSILKLFIGIVSNSVMIFYDAINNLLDVATTTTGTVGEYLRDKPPTRSFPYGFGRIEYLTSFIISSITLAFGILFIFHSAERIIYPLPIYFSWLYFGLLAATVVVKLMMGIGYSILYKKGKSDIIKSLYLDSYMDALITLSAVVCYALTQIADTTLDAIVGVIFGIVIIIATICNIIKQVKNILGTSLDIDIEKIKNGLLEKEIFNNIDIIRISDYGKNKIELFIKGDFNQDKKQDLLDYEEVVKAKIYVIEDKRDEEEN